MSTPPPSEKLNLTIDGHVLAVDKGTTILKAAESVGVEIPTFCYHPGLSAPANCRMCLVNTNKSPKLLPACYATCMEGMEVTTDDDKTLRTRKSTLEFILLHHPVDCPICDQAGECVLQDNYFNHSAQPSRLFTMKGTKPKAEQLGPNVMLDAERCIVCTRCVRFCDEISGSGELRVVNRGERSFVTTFPGKLLDNDYATNTVDICPVGALTSKDFRFKMRVWFLKNAPSVCGGCSRGCNIWLDHGKPGGAGPSEIQRYRPRENQDVNGWWMCDPGRLSYQEFQQDRLSRGRLLDVEHPVKQVVARAARTIARFSASSEASKIAVVPSLMMTNEDAEALARITQKMGLGQWYEGGRPDGKQDDLLQNADKNPNRAGVRAAATAAGRDLKPLSTLAADIASGKVGGVLWLGHEHAQDDALASALGRLEVRIVLASNESVWTRGAAVVLPIRTFEESDGHWTNFEGKVQRLTAGPDPRGEAKPAWDLLLGMARRMGHLDVPTRPTAVTVVGAAPSPVGG
ncbi:MAG: NADH-quinone oxidoreductase subunit G [Myxococcota bacterium]|jgi:NADH-quinone oxidoreductase subunit G